MKPYIFLFFIFAVATLPGCTGKEPVYRGVYEGLRMREQIVNPSDDPCAPTAPPYDEYREERERILKPDRPVPPATE